MKDKLLIKRSRLQGTVEVSGAKNSALRLLAASILTNETLHLKNYPRNLLDCIVHVDMLKKIGKNVNYNGDDEIFIAEDNNLNKELVWSGRSIRNTLLILGALTTRFGFGRVPLPGGCKLGERKYDLHVMLLERLGAKVWEEGDYLCAEAPKSGLMGTDIYLPIRSTGATENSIICGTLANGITRIWNPHIRPEILDLISMLKSMGAKINVFGQEHIEITGVPNLSGAKHEVIPDSMEAITWMCASVMTGGDIEILNFPSNDIEVLIAHLKAAGAKIYSHDHSVIVKGGCCYPIEISTGPHPGINSDVQPLLAAWATRATGISKVIDLRFPGRYAYASQMALMGANCEVDGDMLIINGNGGGLSGAEVKALDLRAGAALALCGLTANGDTIISDAWQILRGYENFVDKLVSIEGYCAHIDA